MSSSNSSHAELHQLYIKSENLTSPRFNLNSFYKHSYCSCSHRSKWRPILEPTSRGWQDSSVYKTFCCVKLADCVNMSFPWVFFRNATSLAVENNMASSMKGYSGVQHSAAFSRTRATAEGTTEQPELQPTQERSGKRSFVAKKTPGR